MISSVDLAAHYGVSRAKDWVSVDCGTKGNYFCDFLFASLDISKLVFIGKISLLNYGHIFISQAPKEITSQIN